MTPMPTPRHAAPTKLPPGARGILPTIWLTFLITVVLSLAFSFGNVWNLGKAIGVDPRIAPLIGPTVDITAIGLLIVVPWLVLAGIDAERLRPANRLMKAAGTLTLTLNSAPSAIKGWVDDDPHAWGRAFVEAIVPFLLIAWSHVGPQLVALFVEIRDTRAAALESARQEAAANASRAADERSAEVARAVADALATEAAQHARELAEAAAQRAELESSLQALQARQEAPESTRREVNERRSSTRSGASRKPAPKTPVRAPRRSLDEWVALAKERLPEWQMETPSGPVVASSLDLSSDGTISKIRQRLEADRLALSDTWTEER